MLGDLVEEVSLEEAQKIAERLGEPVPPQIISESPVNNMFRAATATGGGTAVGVC